MYEHYWDLTQNNDVSGKYVKNPCLRNREIGAGEVYFTSQTDGDLSYPTNLGWFVLNPNSWIYSEPISFGNSHQMTMEFEIFPLEPTFSIEVYPYEVDFPSKTNRMKFVFTQSSTTVVNPSLTATGVLLQAQKWNQVSWKSHSMQVFICLGFTEVANTMRVSIYSRVLVASSVTSQTPSSFMSDVATSTYKISGNQIKLSIFGSKVIYAEAKFISVLLQDRLL